jgi:hypothetical protein
MKRPRSLRSRKWLQLCLLPWPAKDPISLQATFRFRAGRVLMWSSLTRCRSNFRDINFRLSLPMTRLLTAAIVLLFRSMLRRFGRETNNSKWSL